MKLGNIDLCDADVCQRFGTTPQAELIERAGREAWFHFIVGHWRLA